MAVIEFTDKSQQRDPTQTRTLRELFRMASSRRVNTLSRLLRVAIIEHNMLGLANGPVKASVGMSNNQKLTIFAQWLKGAVANIMVMEGKWMEPFMEKAYTSGTRGAQKYVSVDLNRKMDRIFVTHATNELEGIANASIQAIVRTAAIGIRSDIDARHLFSNINLSLRKIALPRLNGLTNTLTCQIHNASRLDQFFSAGHRKFGVAPEHIPTPHVHDAKPRRRKRSGGSSSTQFRKVFYGVQTAEDDRVCPECESISEEGPYTFEEASALLPAHDNCRCVLVPASDTIGDFNPNHDPGTGEFAAGGGSGSRTVGMTVKIAQAKKDVQSFLEGKSAREVIAAVARSHAAKEAVSTALQGLVSHGLGLDAGTWKLNEDLIDHVVKEASTIASISKLQAKELIGRTVKGLIKLRTSSKKDADEDLVLKYLTTLDKALDDYEPEEEG